MCCFSFIPQDHIGRGQCIACGGCDDRAAAAADRFALRLRGVQNIRFRNEVRALRLLRSHGEIRADRNGHLPQRVDSLSGICKEGVAAEAGGLIVEIHPDILLPQNSAHEQMRQRVAVITGRDHRKYAVSDLCLIPRYAILDPTLSAGLPPHITAETGMDALTHAVEAYLSRFYNTRKTREQAERAVVTIFSHLERAYRDGASLPDRAAMLQASFDAGAAFTRASVGNVHAIAHTLGGLYGTAHGLANAVLLPIVLEDYGAAAYPRLARLAHLVGIQEASAEASARAFIAEIRAMNARMGIPDHFDCIRSEDIPLMASWACREANPVYPVPVIYDQARFARVIERSRAEP